MVVFNKDFLCLKDTSAEDIRFILKTAEAMKFLLGKSAKKAPHLQGKSVVMLFYEKSSRTRLSYELAAQYLSANIVNMNIPSDFKWGYSKLTDIGSIIDQMGGDFIIIRHPMAGAAKMLAESVNASVLNAGDGINENPSQSLLDLMTIKEYKGKFAGLRIVLIGDVAYSRVAKSNIWALLKLGADVSVVAPPTLIPAGLNKFGVHIYTDAALAVKDADVIMSLKMRLNHNDKNLVPSLNEYKNLFIIDNKLLRHAKEDAIVMHPGPINRGIEVAAEVIESSRCLVNDQITNGVAVRMALLYLLSMKGGVI